VRRLSQALRGVEGLALHYLYGSASGLKALSQIVERVSKALQISKERADPHRILSKGVKLLDVGDEEERPSSRLQAIYPTLREDPEMMRSSSLGDWMKF